MATFNTGPFGYFDSTFILCYACFRTPTDSMLGQERFGRLEQCPKESESHTLSDRAQNAPEFVTAWSKTSLNEPKISQVQERFLRAVAGPPWGGWQRRQRRSACELRALGAGGLSDCGERSPPLVRFGGLSGWAEHGQRAGDCVRTFERWFQI